MADRPIIFSAAMVRALLAGRKTQTRRLATSPLRRCAPGDQLWVRESFFVMSDDYGWDDYVTRQCCQPDRTLAYCADQSGGPMVDDQEWEPPRNAKREVHGLQGDDDSEAWTLIGNIPSIYMPRWASRMALIVEAVRVEPLQAITEYDATQEGVTPFRGDPTYTHHVEIGPGRFLGGANARKAYERLWRMLHDKPGQRWEDNPDVVALTFRVESGNIDRIAANG